ncbi:hypothetical protein NUU61_002135 [Penicillium alfredii]|uniref:Uncharacterized protein n=1 Tax=Penicillium alfredii TaxID=1506179 RepID=A0A9W9KGJ5_9EURO|nr:uncharacterized protein NUU61_002135 [Penicillium alfredii]KAJ5104788.1 hypothetical protein NUU61_002135 [Penicillium alfredii]
MASFIVSRLKNSQNLVPSPSFSVDDAENLENLENRETSLFETRCSLSFFRPILDPQPDKQAARSESACKKQP